MDMCNSADMGQHVRGLMPVESGPHDPSGDYFITSKNGSGVL